MTDVEVRHEIGGYDADRVFEYLTNPEDLEERIGTQIEEIGIDFSRSYWWGKLRNMVFTSYSVYMMDQEHFDITEEDICNGLCKALETIDKAENNFIPGLEHGYKNLEKMEKFYNRLNVVLNSKNQKKIKKFVEAQFKQGASIGNSLMHLTQYMEAKGITNHPFLNRWEELAKENVSGLEEYFGGVLTEKNMNTLQKIKALELLLEDMATTVCIKVCKELGLSDNNEKSISRNK